MQRRALIAVVVIALVAAGGVAVLLFQRSSLTPDAGKRITLDAPAQPDMTEPADQPDPGTPQQTEATQPGATAEPESEPAKPRSGERQGAEPAVSAETPRTVTSEGAPATESEPSPEGQAVAEAETDGGPTAEGAPSPEGRAAVEPEGGGDAAGETASAAAPPVRPSFDIVRVERSGEAVIAGRAAPGSQVTVLEGDEPIGSVRADKRGEWVLVPDRPLRPGDRQLSLNAVTPDGKTVASEEVVVVSLPGAETRPAPSTTDAGAGERPADAPAEATPSREAGDEQVARAPEATAATEAAETGRAVIEDEEKPEVPVEPAAIGDSAPEAQPEAPLAVVTTRSGEGPVRVLQSPESPAALKEGELVLLAVNYTGDGRITVSGRAPADARLLLYLNNDMVAHTRADAGNRWRMSPERDVPPGLHILRVDQVDESGQVIARVETPFSRSAMVGSLDTEGFVIVQPGNNLWRIARRTYGRGWQYTVIYEANQDQIRDPDLIYPGQVFVLPETE